MISETDGDATSCDLLGPVGIAVQVSITVVCMIAMFCVWYCETPRRKFLDWAFDVSKQVVGACYGKVYNITQAMLFSKLLGDSTEYQDQCVWYLMGISTDCFILTFICYGVIWCTRPLLLNHCGIDIGEYEKQDHPPGDHPEPEVYKTVPLESPCISQQSLEPLQRKCSEGDSETSASDARPPECLRGKWRMWACQILIWLLQLTGARLVLSSVFYLCQHQLYHIFAEVFVLLQLKTATMKLVFAALLFPAFSDTFQILVQDCFLKDSEERRKTLKQGEAMKEELVDSESSVS